MYGGNGSVTHQRNVTESMKRDCLGAHTDAIKVSVLLSAWGGVQQLTSIPVVSLDLISYAVREIL